jgi:hypothetical protein
LRMACCMRPYIVLRLLIGKQMQEAYRDERKGYARIIPMT